MVYSGVNVTQNYPNQIIEIDVSNTPNPSINALSWVRFSEALPRYNAFYNYLTDPDSGDVWGNNPTDQYIQFPPVSTLNWDIGDRADSYLSLKIYGTGDSFINIVPDRVVPTLTATTDYVIDGTIKSVPYKVTLTEDEVDLTRFDDLYLDTTGRSTSALTFSAGVPHLKATNRDFEFVQFLGAETFVSGQTNNELIYFSALLKMVIDSQDVTFNVRPSLEDPTQLTSVAVDPENGSYCTGNAVLTGTIDYPTGAWNISFNCGSTPQAGSYMDLSTIERDTGVPANYVVNGTTPDIKITSTQPVYLYDINIDTSNDGGSNYGYGFTIHFDLEGRVVNNFTDNPRILPKMVDLYNQMEVDLVNTFSIWRITTDDEDVEADLSFTDSDSVDYTLGTWLDANKTYIEATNLLSASNVYNFVLEVSSTNLQVLSSFVEVQTSSAFGELYLSAGNTSDDLFDHYLELNIEIDVEDDTNIYYDIDPNYNGTTLVNCEGDEILLETPYSFWSVSCLSAIGVGPGITSITVSSESLGLSSVLDIESQLTFDEFDVITDSQLVTSCDLTNSYSISAYLLHRDTNIEYALPTEGEIFWNLSANSVVELTAINRIGEKIYDLEFPIEALHNDILDLKIILGDGAAIDSIGEEIGITVGYSSNEGDSISAADPFFINTVTTPDTTLYSPHFSIISSGIELASSENTVNYPIQAGTHTLTFSADLPFNFGASVGSLDWDVDGSYTGGTSEVTDTITIASLETKTITLSSLESFIPSWQYPFCLTDKINLIGIPSDTVEILAFPQNRYAGADRTLQDFNNYNATLGNTAYNAGHTETFYLSAEPGYDLYVWSIGDASVETTSNRTTLGVPSQGGLIGVDQVIWLSAYDYDKSTNVPFIGVSDNSSLLTSHVVFKDYIGFSLSATISEDVFDLNENESEPFFLNLKFNQLSASPVQVVGDSTFTIKLSSANSTDIIDVDMDSDEETYFDIFTLNPEDAFSIPRNTYSVINLCISADLNTRITDAADYDFRDFETNTVIIPITAYNGPFLSISTESNCVDIDTIVEFTNTTPTFIGVDYSDFYFDDGNGNIMGPVTNEVTLTGSYTETGPHSPSMSATVVSTGAQVVKTFNSFIIVDCDSGCETYNSSLTRSFPETLELPNSFRNITMPPNQRVTSLEFNSTISKLYENFEYLINQSKIYSLDVPTEVVDNIYHPDIGTGAIDCKTRNGFFFFITGEGNVKIVDGTNIDNYTLPVEDRVRVIKDDNNITDAEFFIRPIAIDVSSDGEHYVVLDSGTQSVYVFNFDYDTNLSTIVTYWGGQGSRSAKTKFNNFNEVIIGSDDSIYISDRDSFIIKKYNKYFNWVANIEYKDFLKDRTFIESMAVDANENIYILGNDQVVYVLTKDGDFVKKFKVKTTGKIYVNKAYDGIIYIINNDDIFKYTIDGVKINKWQVNFDGLVSVEQQGSLIRVVSADYVTLILDCLSVDKLRDDTLDSNFWSESSMFSNKDEFVQDWVFNDSFEKFSQNLDMFRRSIINKFITYADPFNADGVLYQMVPISIDDFNGDYDPSDIFIGVNEYVTYEVFERVISKLEDNMNSLLTTIKSKPINASEVCEFSDCYTWVKTTTNNVLQPNNCSSNPISWVELASYGITNWNGLSCSSAEDSEFKKINYDASLAKNRVPSKIDKCIGDDK